MCELRAAATVDEGRKAVPSIRNRIAFEFLLHIINTATAFIHYWTKTATLLNQTRTKVMFFHPAEERMSLMR